MVGDGSHLLTKENLGEDFWDYSIHRYYRKQDDQGSEWAIYKLVDQGDYFCSRVLESQYTGENPTLKNLVGKWYHVSKYENSFRKN